MMPTGFNSLSNLRKLYGFTNLSNKDHPRNLKLSCTSRQRDGDPLLEEDENTSNNGQQQIEEMFDELCPPQSLESLNIEGYFGRDYQAE
jgi:hypothetical protein